MLEHLRKIQPTTEQFKQVVEVAKSSNGIMRNRIKNEKIVIRA